MEESWVIAANKTLDKAKSAIKIINKAAAANHRKSGISCQLIEQGVGAHA